MSQPISVQDMASEANDEDECEKALYGSPKCFTMASTSGFKNECRWG